MGIRSRQHPFPPPRVALAQLHCELGSGPGCNCSTKAGLFFLHVFRKPTLACVLGGLGNKFRHVSRVDSYIDKPRENTIFFCHAFPCVRHASMHAQDVVVFAKLTHVTNVLPKGRLALGLQYEVEEKWRCQIERCFA